MIHSQRMKMTQNQKPKTNHINFGRNFNETTQFEHRSLVRCYIVSVHVLRGLDHDMWKKWNLVACLPFSTRKMPSQTESKE